MSDQHPTDPNAVAPEEALQDYVDLMLVPCDLDEQVEKQTAAKLREEQARLAEKKKPAAKKKTHSSPKKRSDQKSSELKPKAGPASNLSDAESNSTLPLAATRVVNPLVDSASARPGQSQSSTLPLNRRSSIDIPVLGAEYPADTSPEPVPQLSQKPLLADTVATRKQTVLDDESSTTRQQKLNESLVRNRVKQLTERMPEPAREALDTRTQEPPETQTEQPPQTQTESSRVHDESPLEAPSAKDGYALSSSAEVQQPEQYALERDVPDGWINNGRPDWAQQPFECLLFKLSGLTLAVPLVELGSIYPMHNELTPIFGQADWFMGLFSVQNITLRAVDTAKVIMPERYQPSMRESLRYIISINGFDWGLAVDAVEEAITLTPEDVRWRTIRSKRPWLAGTVVEHMCALLDVRAMAKDFDKASPPRST